jgi:hypothetical protein
VTPFETRAYDLLAMLNPLEPPNVVALRLIAREFENIDRTARVQELEKFKDQLIWIGEGATHARP